MFWHNSVIKTISTDVKKLALTCQKGCNIFEPISTDRVGLWLDSMPTEFKTMDAEKQKTMFNYLSTHIPIGHIILNISISYRFY